MVLSNISFVLPTTLLGFFSTKSAVGYYYTANRIIRMIISLFSAMITVLVPHMNRVLEEKGKDYYLDLVNNCLVFVITFGVPISFFVFLLSNPLVIILAGKDYTNTIFLIELMSPIIFIVALAQVFVLLILSVNRKDKLMVFISTLGILVSVTVNLLFMSSLSEKATALSQLASEFTITILSYFLTKKILNYTFPFNKLFLNLVFVLPFFILTTFVNKITSNNLFILMMSFLLCGTYFFIYQFFIIKNQMVINIVPWFFAKANRLKNSILNHF
jgi:O-antigen/teichoic acid export membrane protein